MRFSRDLTGIPVIHGPSGRVLGRVREWLLDQHGEAVLAFSAEASGWLPQVKVFAYHEVVGLGSDAVIVATDQPDINDAEQPPVNVLGKRVITAKGQELGVVEDVLFEERTGRVTGLRLSSGLIDDLLSGRPVMEAHSRFTIGDDVLIVQDEPNPEGVTD